MSLVAAWQEDGKLLRNQSTKPRLTFGPHGPCTLLEWSTNEFRLVEEHSLLCYQALMVAVTTFELATAGIRIVRVPDTLHLSANFPLAGASFTEINHMFDMSTGCGSAFYLGRPLLKIENVLDVFTRSFGTFAIHSWHYHDLDIDHEEAGIPHYLLYNATTRLLQCYPEVCTALACS